ncbi:response regulator [Archaeoglobus neptunius]|uniref:response regulator n=1 Tax=Archaeoglobus neptunius TaxID=2798580 RepID=UPI001928920D|nr:response regulator [Archaeoglobus neptunius]
MKWGRGIMERNLKPRILVVEDDLAVLEALKLMLEERYEVVVAVNGKEAVALFERFKPDIILMDIAMPEMDGVAATKEILKRDPDAIVLCITAFKAHRGKEMLEAGAKEIIEKPFTRRQLIEKIEHYLQKQKV